MKWFISDMDGTFLDDNRQIAPNSKAVMRKVKEKNSKFIIATGRVDLAVRNYYHQMDLSDAVISCNGAFIRNLSTGKIIYENYFTNEELDIIYQKYLDLTDGSIAFHLYSKNYIYCDHLSMPIKKIMSSEENASLEFKTPIVITENVIEKLVDNKEVCYKVLLSSDNHQLLRTIHQEVAKVFELEGVFSAKDYFDLTPKGTSKAEAIKILADYYQLDIKDSVVFGDNFNDIDMLNVAGLAVCPNNAIDEVKNIAHQIIGNNNNFSVIQYIENVLGE